MNNGITLTAGGKESLFLIEPLWNELNAHHAAIESQFQNYYRSRRFADRLTELELKTGTMRVVRAHAAGSFCGCCVSSVSAEGTGEIDSLVVSSALRGQGTGRILIEDALAWLSSMNAAKIILSVYEGNTDAARFYERHGFAPKYTVYEKKSQEN